MQSRDDVFDIQTSIDITWNAYHDIGQLTMTVLEMFPDDEFVNVQQAIEAEIRENNEQHLVYQ